MIPLRNFTHDLEAMAEAVTPRDAARLPRQPEQPDRARSSGAASGRRSCAPLPPRQLIVVADDAYAEYVEDPEYPDTVGERGDGSVPVVTLRTFSKLYGLAGPAHRLRRRARRR